MGKGIHSADVCNEPVFHLHRLATNASVEVQSARVKTTRTNDVVENDDRLLHIHGELVRIPSQHRIARVGVDRPKHALAAGEDDVVLVVVTRQGRVIRLDVELEVVLEVVLAEEADHRLRVVVVLVLGRLARLRLDQEREVGANLLLVVHRHAQETTQVIELLAGESVQDALITLTTAPEHVVLAAELLRDLHALLHLGRSIGKHVSIGVRGGAVHVDAVSEQVRRSPEKPHSRLLLLLQHVVGDDVQTAVRLLQRIALGNEVAVVEAVVVDAKLGEELEGSVALFLRFDNGILISAPRTIQSGPAKHVVPLIAERMPVANRET